MSGLKRNLSNKSANIGSFPLEDSLESYTVKDPTKLLRKRIEDKHLQKLTQININKLDSLFSKVQSEESATIDREKFQDMLREIDFALVSEPEAVTSFYNALDVNEDGTVNKKELLIGFTILANGELDKKLEFCFEIYDLNGDGFIQRQELDKMLHMLAQKNHNFDNWTQQEQNEWILNFVNSTFDEYDDNKDDKLSFEEFKKAAISRQDIAQIFTLEGILKHK